MSLSVLPWIAAALLLALGLRRLDRAVRAAAVADWGHRGLNWLDGLNRLFCRHWHRLQADTVDLPESGGAIVVANHVSGLDPLLMVAACRRPLHFMIAAEEYRRYGLTWLFRAMGCIPVDRSGRPERALRAAARALERGQVVALFPHGRIHLDSDPPRRLRPGAAWLSELTDTPIYPLRIDGVRGQGKTILAVVPRSRARVTAHPSIQAHITGKQDCLERLARILDASRVETPPQDPI